MSDITLYAHRGSNPYPDHSREAYVWAINWGADVIEPDLFLTKDGVLVASHDNHNYSNLTYAEAKAAEPALMTFGEVIEIAKAMSIETGREIGIIPETKNTSYATSEAVIRELIAHDFTDPDRVVIQSFAASNLQQLHDTIMPQYGVDIPLAFLGYSMANLDQVATYADIIAPNQAVITEAGVAAAHAAGLKVVAWTIRGTEAQIQRLIDMGVDGVFVDETNTARQALSNINGVKVVYGTEADDDVSGTAGNDLIYAMAGDDTIGAGEGDDEAYGDGGDDAIDGEAGNDVLVGGAGDDELAGGEGDDVLKGGVGDDLLDGGEGIDTADYSGDTAGVTVDLSAGAASGDEAGEDELADIENAIGGAGNDTLIGDDEDNRLAGGLGNDTIKAGSGDDQIEAGAGNDVIDAGSGDDEVHGGAGNDAIDGGEGDDELNGDEGDDVLKGGAGDDELAGGAGNDTLIGAKGDDLLDGGEGIDVADYSAGTAAVTVDLASGTATGEGIGDDELVDIENVTGGKGADTITGDDFVNVIRGGDGADTLEGGGGNDTLYGDAGSDTIHGDDGEDRIYAGGSADFVHGGAGADLVYGSDGNDEVHGDDGNDQLHGEGGNDTLHGDAGNDTLYGGIGNDTLTGGEGNDQLYGQDGDDTLMGGAGSDKLDGGTGNDRIKAGAGDTVQGGTGDDVVEVAADSGAPASIDGGAGVDTVNLLGSGTDALGATTGVENLVVQSGTWSVAAADYATVTIKDSAALTSTVTLNKDDRLTIETGGKLVAGTAIVWAGGGNAVVANSGLIEASSRALNTVAGAEGSLAFNNLAGGVVRGALSPQQAAHADATITLNNAGLIEASGRVIDFRSFDGNGASAVINNLAGGIIRQYGSDSDVIRPGVGGTINNWGTITTADGFAGGGDLIDFQSDTGGKVNNHAGGHMEGSRHVVTGDNAVTVTNNGTMIGRNGSAVNIDNGGSEAEKVFITNRGTMEGRSAKLSDSDGDAVDVDGLVQVLNYGRIAGLGANGRHDGEANVSEGIAIGGGTILNYGANAEIYGYGRAIQVDNSSNSNALGKTFINNEGLIRGDGHGPEGVTLTPAEVAKFDLRGNEAINLVGDYNDEILNQSTGRIVGGVSMGGGNDHLQSLGSFTATGGSAIDMGAGNDTMYLYTGTTVQGRILLGTGNDLVLSTADSGFVIDAGDGDDQMYISGSTGGNDTLSGGAGNDMIYSGLGNDRIDGGEGNDTLNGESGDDVIDGGAGDDLIFAGLGNDAINGGAGFDTLDVSAATGPISVDFSAGKVSGAGIGSDSFTGIEKLLFGAGNDVVTGGNGNDAFDGGAGNDTLKGGSGDDTLWGGEGGDALDGGSGDDALHGGLGNDVIKAGSGDDRIEAGEGNDVVDAGSGDDRIAGGAGNDQLSGGSGQDVFVFAAGFGKDTITDFKTTGSSSDVLEFDIDLFANFDALIETAHQVGADTVFTIDADTSLTLRNVQLSSLHHDNFAFI